MERGLFVRSMAKREVFAKYRERRDHSVGSKVGRVRYNQRGRVDRGKDAARAPGLFELRELGDGVDELGAYLAEADLVPAVADGERRAAESGVGSK